MFSRSNSFNFGGPTVNQPAFFIGALAALFGVYGIAHLLNGKVFGFLIFLVLGFIWDAAFAFLALVTLHCLTVPMFIAHLVLVFVISRNGATR